MRHDDHLKLERLARYTVQQYARLRAAETQLNAAASMTTAQPHLVAVRHYRTLLETSIADIREVLGLPITPTAVELSPY